MYQGKDNLNSEREIESSRVLGNPVDASQYMRSTAVEISNLHHDISTLQSQTKWIKIWFVTLTLIFGGVLIWLVILGYGLRGSSTASEMNEEIQSQVAVDELEEKVDDLSNSLPVEINNKFQDQAREIEELKLEISALRQISEKLTSQPASLDGEKPSQRPQESKQKILIPETETDVPNVPPQEKNSTP